MEKGFKNKELKIKPKIIVITGAESTGKTTLTEQLAKNFNVPFIPEIARQYVENLNGKYTFQDVETIAKMQIEQFNRAITLNSPFVFLDTWLIVTKIWFEFVYKEVPDWLIFEIEKTKIDLFLVCDIDLPWVFDPVRENGGENRKILHNKYIEEIKKFNFNYKIVKGTDVTRLNNALRFLSELK
jgi:NadR type nicotinamide-nucleotide adenylyltransferase